MRKFMIKNGRNSLLTIFLILIGVFLLTGCDEKDPLIGTWQEPGSGIIMQFKDDGDLVMSNEKTSITVAYEKKDENAIIVKASTDGSIPDQTILYRVEEDRLILTVGGVESIFKAVK